MTKLSTALSFAAVVALGAAPGPARSHEVIYTAIVNGASEAPPNASPGFGAAIVTFDLDLFTMDIQASFAGLLGTTMAAHIHCCTAVPGVSTAGVATETPSLAGFPIGVGAAVYSHHYDMTLASSYNPTFIADNGGTVGTASSALLAGLAAGKGYLNIHSTSFPGGEIRGFLVAVPEPKTYGLMLAGLAGLGWILRRRQHARAPAS